MFDRDFAAVAPLQGVIGDPHFAARDRMGRNLALLCRVAASGWLPSERATALQAAHATLLELGLACTLDRRPRLAPTTPAIEDACAAISAACVAAELPFA